MKSVYIRHPVIGGAPVEVPESSVSHWTGGGWEVVDPPPPPVRPARPAPVEVVPAPRPARRIAAPKED